MGAAPPSAGGFDLDFALFPYSLLVAGLHPTKPGSEIPESFIPWPLGASKGTGETLAQLPGHPGHRPQGGLGGEGGSCPASPQGQSSGRRLRTLPQPHRGRSG